MPARFESASGFIGVQLISGRQLKAPYKMRLQLGTKEISVGGFSTAIEAAKAYNLAIDILQRRILKLSTEDQALFSTHLNLLTNPVDAGVEIPKEKLDLVVLKANELFDEQFRIRADARDLFGHNPDEDHLFEEFVGKANASPSDLETPRTMIFGGMPDSPRGGTPDLETARSSPTPDEDESTGRKRPRSKKV